MSSRLEKLPVIDENNTSQQNNASEKISKEKALKQEEKKEKMAVIAEEKKESNKLKNEVRINDLINEEFMRFKADLLLDTKADYKLRKERNLDIEKNGDYKFLIKSYGQSCEVNLETGEVSYINWWKSLLLWRSQPFLTFSFDDFELMSSDLYKVFWQMNVINRAMYKAAEAGPEDEFRIYGISFLFIGKKNVLSFKWIKKWFGDDVDEKQFVKMLNKILLSK